MLFLYLCLLTPDAFAQNSKSAFTSTGFPVPRFVSLRAAETYARTGPGKQYPIRYVYHRKNLPVEVVLEYEAWRKIRDQNGDEGWVHQSLLSGKRTGLVQAKDKIRLLRKPKDGAQAMADLEPGALVTIDKCVKGNWCKIEAVGYKGWLPRKNLWGIYENEFFD